MTADALSQIVARGGRGALAGGLAGFVLGALACIADSFLYERVAPLRYVSRGRVVKMRFPESLEAHELDKDVRILQEYRDFHPLEYDKGASCTQKMMDLFEKFKREREIKKDGADVIAKFRNAALRADKSWRSYYYKLEESGQKFQAETAREAAMRLHVAYETILNSMREQFGSDPNVERPAK